MSDAQFVACFGSAVLTPQPLAVDEVRAGVVNDDGAAFEVRHG